MQWRHLSGAAFAAAALFALGRATAATSQWQFVNPQPTGNFVTGLTWGDGKFVGVDDAGMLETSLDGVQWSLSYSGALYTPNDLVWNGSQFLLVGWNGEIMTSPDGETTARPNRRTTARSFPFTT